MHLVGDFQMTVADNRHLGLSQSSVSRCTDRVMERITDGMDNFIKFPYTEDELHENMYEFMVYSGNSCN